MAFTGISSESTLFVNISNIERFLLRIPLLYRLGVSNILKSCFSVKMYHIKQVRA